MTHKMYEAYRTASGKLRYRTRMRVNGKRISKTFSTLSDLKFWIAKLEKVRRDTRLGEDTYLPTSVRAASDRWFVEHVDIHMSPSMRVCNREIFAAQVLPTMGERDLRDIKADEWESFLAKLALDREWAAATFNRRRALIMSFYNWCMEKGLVPENPMRRIKKRREAEKEPRFFTTSQLKNILEVCESATYATCFYILANTGMRISEALGLRWCDVDLSGGWIRIGRIFCRATMQIEERTKGGHSRIIGLNGALREVLLRERQRGHSLGSQDLIVAMPNGQSPGHPRVRNVFESNVRKSGLGHHGLHDLRHSFASAFMMSGGSLWDLKTILGHSTIDLTERYSHFSPSHLRQQAEQVSFGVSRSADVVAIRKKNPFLATDDFKTATK